MTGQPHRPCHRLVHRRNRQEKQATQSQTTPLPAVRCFKGGFFFKKKETVKLTHKKEPKQSPTCNERHPAGCGKVVGVAVRGERGQDTEKKDQASKDDKSGGSLPGGRRRRGRLTLFIRLGAEKNLRTLLQESVP